LLSAHPDSHAEALSLVTYAEIPPHGLVENLRNFVLFDRESDQPMGILSLYLGYPDPNIYYIGSLYLRPSWQRGGYGRELMQELEQQLQGGEYAAGRVAVGLKNWPALSFWTKQGYDTVTMISGDRTYAADHYAVIELQKDL
jgi:ribosomal protein S18 acetylase RimI-like enzyme